MLEHEVTTVLVLMLFNLFNVCAFRFSACNIENWERATYLH